MKETLLFPTIYCASDRGGCVSFGNRYWQYIANVTSFGDGRIKVKVIHYDEWRKLRNTDGRFEYDKIRNLGTLEGHFYLYDNDCSHGRKDDAIMEFKGTFYLYDFMDSYDPTLYIITGLNIFKEKYIIKQIKTSKYQDS